MIFVRAHDDLIDSMVSDRLAHTRGAAANRGFEAPSRGVLQCGGYTLGLAVALLLVSCEHPCDQKCDDVVAASNTI